MKELEFIDIIKNKLDDSSYLGDDCAYLSELGIFITQDTLVEDVHFSLDTISSYFLGRKSVSVNLSDLAASLSEPKYISVSISLPKTIQNNFVEELYRGINDVCTENKVKVIGGDITGSDKVMISICAIGKKRSNYLTSRSFAKEGDYILVSGNFGASAAGFFALSNFLFAEEILINAHLNPIARIKEAVMLSDIINSDIALMDCSDGLIDALYKISLNSNHSLIIDINKVPVLGDTVKFCKRNSLDYKELVKWGAEDYELLICVNENIYQKLDKSVFTCIGRVHKKDTQPKVTVIDNEKEYTITKDIFEKKSYNHFN